VRQVLQISDQAAVGVFRYGCKKGRKLDLAIRGRTCMIIRAAWFASSLAGSATHSPLLQIHSQRRGNLAPLAFNVIPKKLYNVDLPNQRGVISDNAVLKKEYEKTNIFSGCDIRFTSNSHLSRRTGSIFETGFCASSTATAGFLLQRERIRYWSLRDICNRNERRGDKANRVWWQALLLAKNALKRQMFLQND
jgi:hypothetical protein